MLQTTGTNASSATLCRTLGRLGMTRKKLKYVTLQCSNILRAEHQSEVSLFDHSMLILILLMRVTVHVMPEILAESMDSYSLHGKTFRFFSRGKRFSAITVLTTTKLLGCYIVEDTVNGDIFHDFVQSTLLPHLQPFNGINPNSAVVLDNCSIHHVDDVVIIIQSVGVLVTLPIPILSRSDAH